MIRKVFIDNQVLNIYRKMETISFPIDPQSVIKLIPNCRYMSYQKMAELNDSSIDDVIKLCESNSGCTHYDLSSQRYLILCNQDPGMNAGRKRWTCSHEIGHIICNHHVLSAYDKLSENSLLQISNQEYETEADYFSASLLAPFPFFELLNISCPADIHDIFGLSMEASTYRYNRYLYWRKHRIKTAWHNDMQKVFLQKAK